MLPFTARPKPSVDALVDILRMGSAPGDQPLPVKRVFAAPEQVMHRLHRAERELAEARRDAMELDLIGAVSGADVQKPDAKPESAWEREKSELGPVPKTAAQREVAAMRSRDLSKPVVAEAPDASNEAIAARFSASTPEQQAAMISAAAKKGVRLPRGK